MLYFYKNSCSRVCWILLIWTPWLLASLSYLPSQSNCAFFYNGSSILSFDLAILFPKRDTQCTHTQAPLKIFQHLPNGTAASCSTDVIHSLYLFEDFEVPFRLFFYYVHFFWTKFPICLVCFRMLVFPCVLWNFHLNTNPKWGFLVFVFLHLSPQAIPLYMMARAFLSHCLMLRVSVPFQILGGELDSSSGPFPGWGGVSVTITMKKLNSKFHLAWNSLLTLVLTLYYIFHINSMGLSLIWL